MSKFAKPKVYKVGICNALRKAPFLAGIPPLNEWLQSNLHNAYGERFDEVRAAYLNLDMAIKDTPANDLSSYPMPFRTEGDYKRDGRIYSIILNFADGYASPEKIGTPHLPRCEALMLRAAMTVAMFRPEERDVNYQVRRGEIGVLNVNTCQKMQDWCEEAYNFTEMALEHTLYLHEIKERMRLLKKWTSHHVLGRINPDWGNKHKLSPLDVTDRQWRNATDPATNKSIYQMLDNLTLIEFGAKELPFLGVSAEMTTVRTDDAPVDYVNVC